MLIIIHKNDKNVDNNQLKQMKINLMSIKNNKNEPKQ